MQRILPRGEIEALDHNVIPRLGLPERGQVFRARAARLRHLAPGNPIEGYLALMAVLADAQHEALARFVPPPVPEDRILLAQAHGMPPLQATGAPRDGAWQDILVQLLDHMLAAPGLAPMAADACATLRQAVLRDPAGMDRAATALLAEGAGAIDVAAAPFLMAALQVYWTGLACDFDPARLPVVSPFGLCPLCGSLPVASLVRVGGQYTGYRYLCCALCSAQWHMVRVKCTHCEETRGIAYQAIEGGSGAIKAETCETCRNYRKIFYQEKDLYAEPMADDLGSLGLDIMLGGAGYRRASGNPLLWQGDEEEGA